MVTSKRRCTDFAGTTIHEVRRHGIFTFAHPVIIRQSPGYLVKISIQQLSRFSEPPTSLWVDNHMPRKLQTGKALARCERIACARFRQRMSRSLQLSWTSVDVTGVETARRGSRSKRPPWKHRCPICSIRRRVNFNLPPIQRSHLFTRSPTMPLMIGDLLPTAAIQVTPERAKKSQARQQEEDTD